VISGALIIAVYASVIYVYTGWAKSRYTDHHYYTIIYLFLAHFVFPVNVCEVDFSIITDSLAQGVGV